MPIYKQNLQHIQPFISVPLLLSVTQICIQVSVLGQKFYKQYKPNKIYFWFFLFKILFYLPTIQIQEYFVGLWQHHWIMTQKPKQWKILGEDYVMCFSLWAHKQASQTKYSNIFYIHLGFSFNSIIFLYIFTNPWGDCSNIFLIWKIY